MGELAASADSGETVAKVNRVSVISRNKVGELAASADSGKKVQALLVPGVQLVAYGEDLQVLGRDS